MPTVPPDVWIPLHPPSVSGCPNIALARLASVLPWRDPPSTALQAWAKSKLRYPLGTVIRDVVAGAPVVARVECHFGWGADPSKPGRWHRGTSIYRPAQLDARSGAVVPLTSPPPGWPGSSTA